MIRNVASFLLSFFSCPVLREFGDVFLFFLLLLCLVLDPLLGQFRVRCLYVRPFFVCFLLSLHLVHSIRNGFPVLLPRSVLRFSSRLEIRRPCKYGCFVFFFLFNSLLI